MTVEWRDEAACAERAPLFDASLDGETFHARLARHREAKKVCRTCVVRVECGAAVDPSRDEGIRAGKLLPAVRQYEGSDGGPGTRRDLSDRKKAS